LFFAISVKFRAMKTDRFLFALGAVVVTTALNLTTAEPATTTPKKPVSAK
jgi:hypothetical protein